MPFPIFENHESVTCFGCRQVIEGEAKVSGYGLKHGEYVKQCKCGLSTWYDISGNVLTDAQVMALSWCDLGLTETNRIVRRIGREVLDTLVARGFVVSYPGAYKEWIITPAGHAALADPRTGKQS
jgi:hypothetical protein